MASTPQSGVQVTRCPFECVFFTFPWQLQALLRILWKFWTSSPEKMHIGVNICIWFYGVHSPSVDALEVHGLQVKKLRMRDVSKLVTLKSYFCIPCSERGRPSHLPTVSPTTCGSSSPTLTQIHLLDFCLLIFQMLQDLLCPSEALAEPWVTLASTALVPIVPNIVFSLGHGNT